MPFLCPAFSCKQTNKKRVSGFIYTGTFTVAGRVASVSPRNGWNPLLLPTELFLAHGQVDSRLRALDLSRDQAGAEWESGDGSEWGARGGGGGVAVIRGAKCWSPGSARAAPDTGGGCHRKTLRQARLVNDTRFF